jgi:hypothetical protein
MYFVVYKTTLELECVILTTLYLVNAKTPTLAISYFYCLEYL